jgi:ABC-type transporter Mla maintaining outer membrane lipid asymmetry permease subunit MlaE
MPGTNDTLPSRSISPLPVQAPSHTPAALGFVWHFVNLFLEWFGDLGLFAWQVMRSAVRRPFEGRELIRQLDEIGSKSLPLVSLEGADIGAGLLL